MAAFSASCSPAFPPPFPDLRAQLGAQADFLSQVSQHTLDTLRQLSELHMRAAREIIDDGIRLGRDLAACKDPFQMSTLALRETQPAAVHWRNWQGAVLGVIARGAAAAGPATGPAGGEDVGAAHNPT